MLYISNINIYDYCTEYEIDMSELERKEIF